jgi:hypothetical protein
MHITITEEEYQELMREVREYRKLKKVLSNSCNFTYRTAPFNLVSQETSILSPLKSDMEIIENELIQLEELLK